MQEQSILGGSIFRTRRRAHDLQVIGKVSSRVEIRFLSSSIGHPPHSSASPVELRLRVGPRALSGKKK